MFHLILFKAEQSFDVFCIFRLCQVLFVVIAYLKVQRTRTNTNYAIKNMLPHSSSPIALRFLRKPFNFSVIKFCC